MPNPRCSRCSFGIDCGQQGIREVVLALNHYGIDASPFGTRFAVGTKALARASVGGVV